MMRGPKPVAVKLSDEQRIALETPIRNHTTAQQAVLRAQIILDIAARRSNLAVARSRHVNRETVRLGRQRWMLPRPIPLPGRVGSRRTPPRRVPLGEAALHYGRADLRNRGHGLRASQRVGTPQNPLDQSR
jgi:hypothetical protein